MSASDLLTLLGGSAGGTALAFCILFITGMIVPKATHDEMREQRDEWKRTAELNAARAEASIAAGQVVKDVMVSLKGELLPSKELE